ncbi:MAG: hypothetical protein AB7O28_22470 [Vicinamibacterales bacterium]
MDLTSPTVLWRLWSPSGEQARAVVIPGDPQTTLTLFLGDVMDRAENFDGLDIALFRADDLKASLLGTGWREEP